MRKFKVGDIISIGWGLWKVDSLSWNGMNDRYSLVNFLNTDDRVIRHLRYIDATNWHIVKPAIVNIPKEKL